jgi:Ca2+-binding RTX toxin-like protein
MSIFVGSNAGETITPDFVSPTVKVVGLAKKPTNAADIIIAGGGNDVVNGGGGNDIAMLGAGDDRFIWNPGDGSDIVNGGRGYDTLEFNGSGAAETMTIKAGPLGVAQLTRDVGNIKMLLNDMERIELAAGAGADKIAVKDLANSDIRHVAIDLAATKGGATGDGAADSVSVDGRNSAEQINVTAVGDTVTVTGAAAEVTIARAEAGDSLTVNGLGGNDVIDGSTLPNTSMRLTLDGGKGDDKLLGGANADTLLGGEGNDFIDGNRGNDTAFMGAGDDTFVWDPGDGSDVVEGQAGFDTMLFNGAAVAESVDISANGERVRFFRDIANITMDNNDVERFTFNALGGTDKVVVNDLSGTDAKEVVVDLAAAIGGTTGDLAVDEVTVHGDAGNETLDVTATGTSVSVNGAPALVNILNTEAADKLNVDGGAGNDTINASTLAAGVVTLSLDGGAGDDRILGGAGAEVLLGGDGDDFIDGNRGNDTAFMGAGDDTFVWDPGDGSDVVEGQAGFDTMLFNGAGAAEKIEISANGERAIFFRDLGAITMDNNDVERLEFNALGGADTTTVNDLTGTDVTEVVVDLESTIGSGVGDGAVDSTIVKGTAGDDAVVLSTVDGVALVDGLSAQVRIEHAEGADVLEIKAGAGSDAIDGSSLVTGSITLKIDGGEGDDILVANAGGATLLGGDNDDLLIGGLGNDSLDGGDGVDILFGGGGDDLFVNGELIVDFAAGAGSEDRIDLRGLGLADFNAVLAHAQEIDGSTVLDFGNGITLLDTSLNSLHADDFLL